MKFRLFSGKVEPLKKRGFGHLLFKICAIFTYDDLENWRINIFTIFTFSVMILRQKNLI